MQVKFSPVDSSNISTYIEVGLQSYNEHYLHLWQQGDASAFINENLTENAVETALKDSNQKLFLIIHKEKCVGILKLTLDVEKDHKSCNKNILLNKIYLLKAFSGKGIGQKALRFTEDFAKKCRKDCIWLVTMKKGKALQFYLNNNYCIVNETKLHLENVKPSEEGMYVLEKKLY